MHEFGVIIGRFQPFHNAHLEMVRFALTRVKRLVIIIGSFNQARNIKNPWLGGERITMIESCLTNEEKTRVSFVPVRDYLYNDNIWMTEVQEQVHEHIGLCDDIILLGHKKDASSYYLKMFPKWKFVETGLNEPLNATDIRTKYFRCDADFKKDVPPPVADLLQVGWCTTDLLRVTPESKIFQNLRDEFQHIASYRQAWSGAPFPPIFVTVDAVVIKSGHVLVVRRKGNPGRGLIALPGGFLNQNEKILNGCIRELKEETGIKVPVEELYKVMGKNPTFQVFDHPDRSLRGRTITHAFLINLGEGELPTVKGTDDADKAWWMPNREVFVRENEFFEDHYHIIANFINKY